MFPACVREGHVWHWMSEQKPDDVLIIQPFDSEVKRKRVGVAGGMVNSIVHIDETEDEEARESVEARRTVIW